MFLLWNAVILGTVDPGVASMSEGAVVDPLAALRSGSGGAELSFAVSLFSEFAIVTSFIGFMFGLRDFYADAFADRSAETASMVVTGEDDAVEPASASTTTASRALAVRTCNLLRIMGGRVDGGASRAHSKLNSYVRVLLARAGALAHAGAFAQLYLAMQRALVYPLILVPPLVFAVINPTIFFSALDTAGSFGISVLFGIVPAVMAWKQRYGHGAVADGVGAGVVAREKSGVGAAPEEINVQPEVQGPVPLPVSPMVPGDRSVLGLMAAMASALVVQKAVELAL